MIRYFGIGAGVITLTALFIIINFLKENNDYENSLKGESITTTILFNFPYKNNDDGIKNLLIMI